MVKQKASLGKCNFLVRQKRTVEIEMVLDASEDLIKNIHGVAPVAERDGDEIGFLVAKVAGIKRRR